MLSSLIVSPDSSASSLRQKEAIVTALDQNNQPMSGITINASVSGGNVTVSPGNATTFDGTAKFKFKFRFGFTTNGGEITFRADSLIATIKIKLQHSNSPLLHYSCSFGYLILMEIKFLSKKQVFTG